MDENERGDAPLLKGKYELLSLAGVGGMAEVWKAHVHGASGFRRLVAIKRVLEEFGSNPEFVEMFIEEARVGSELDHPNVVHIHDFDIDDAGRLFLVMEWVDGLDLSQWAEAFRSARRETPWALVIAIGIEILKGLGAAHERHDASGVLSPIFHRDVTPHNVLLSKRGIVKVTDFGLARAMDRARMTRPQILKGKLSYSAPELVTGGDPSAQSDLFGVGIVLWEVLAGGKLFVGDSPLAILERVRDCVIPSIAERRPDVPPALAAVIHRALSPSPEDRYRSARSMARALANILRVTPASTGADVLGSSVIEAREVIGTAPKVAPEEA
jgi:serine/threonine protein kinase